MWLLFFSIRNVDGLIRGPFSGCFFYSLIHFYGNGIVRKRMNLNFIIMRQERPIDMIVGFLPLLSDY